MNCSCLSAAARYVVVGQCCDCCVNAARLHAEVDAENNALNRSHSRHTTH